MTATNAPIPDVEPAFARALAEAGLVPFGGVAIPADGRLHRFRVASDRPGQRTGWAILHGDGVPHGIAGDWRTGERIVWTWDGTKLTPTERARLAEVRRLREAERATTAAAAARKARTLWNRLPVAAAGHAYLARKHVAPGPCRVTMTDSLVVPVTDARTGEMISLQYIRPQGSKRFLAGGRTSGGCCILGYLQGELPVAICEGYATGASVQAATGWPVVVAFFANNLRIVAEAMRRKFPCRKIIIAADDDADTPDNPGLTKATEAARIVNALLAVPPTWGDFNELAAARGGDAVRAAFDSATRPDGTGGPRTDRDDALADLARRAADDPGAPFEPAAIEGADESAIASDADAGPQGQRVILRRLSDVEPEEVAWLWPGRIPRGKLSIIAGDPGLGKSLLTLDMATRVSQGLDWPDGTPCDRGSVVLLSAEDDLSDTVRPRLDAAGADVERVIALTARRDTEGREVEITLRDLEAIGVAIEAANGASLLIVDPVAAHLSAIDSHRDSEVRGLLAPLARLAAEKRVAVVGIVHLTKTGGSPIRRVMGSIAFTAAARAVWAVAKDPDDRGRRLFLPIKNNLGPDAAGLAYRIDATEGVPRLAWEQGPVEVDVNAVLNADFRDRDDSKSDDTRQWLRERLADGPVPVADLKAEASDAGFGWRTVAATKAELRIVSERVGEPGAGRGAGRWFWHLPGHEAASSSKDAGTKSAHFASLNAGPEPAENRVCEGEQPIKDARVQSLAGAPALNQGQPWREGDL